MSPYFTVHSKSQGAIQDGVAKLMLSMANIDVMQDKALQDQKLHSDMADLGMGQNVLLENGKKWRGGVADISIGQKMLLENDEKRSVTQWPSAPDKSSFCM